MDLSDAPTPPSTTPDELLDRMTEATADFGTVYAINGREVASIRSALDEERRRGERLRAQVKEFRQKCDPGENIVLVTAEEIM